MPHRGRERLDEGAVHALLAIVDAVSLVLGDFAVRSRLRGFVDRGTKAQWGDGVHEGDGRDAAPWSRCGVMQLSIG